MIAADRQDRIECFRCPSSVPASIGGMLPIGWDVMRVPGYKPTYFCLRCVDGGAMELYRAQQGLPRRARWRFSGGILAFYQPAARQVLLATPEGMAELSEQEAEQLHAALGEALAVRGLAEQLAVEARR